MIIKIFKFQIKGHEKIYKKNYKIFFDIYAL